MAGRTIRTVWRGDASTGSGFLELGDMKADHVDLQASSLETASARAETTAGSHQSMTVADGFYSGARADELLAAAYSAAFIRRLVGAVEEAGGTSRSVVIFADATLEDPEVPGSASTITIAIYGDAEGIDAAGFDEAVASARDGSPYTKAFSEIDIRIAALLG
jgi:osmotically inducible protein OsmC